MKRFLIALIMAMSCLTSALTAQVGTGGDTVWTKAIGAVEQVRFSPDGQAIYASYLYDSGKPAVALDAQTGEIIRQFPGMNAYRIDLSADGMFLAGCELAGEDTSRYVVYEWNALSGELLGKYGNDGATYKIAKTIDVAYSPDGKYLAGHTTGLDEQHQKRITITIWSRDTRKILNQWVVETTNRLTFSPDGKYLAQSGGTGTLSENFVQLYKTGDWKPYAKLTGHSDAIEDMSFSPDGKYLATGGGDGILKVWDVSKKQIYWEVPKAHLVPEVDPDIYGTVFSLSFLDNNYLLSGGGRPSIPPTVKLWHMPTKQLITTLFSGSRDMGVSKPAIAATGNGYGIILLDFSKYLGAKDKHKLERSKIRPNPCKDKAILEFTPVKGVFYSIKLYDGSFREISTLLEKFLDNHPQKVTINTDTLANGVYYIQISSATTSQTISFIVEK